ncbi:PREDICTED: protein DETOXIFICATION 45, chloroplastic isoform X2 [Theobroma cacao]|uniref:Protein DETOXIFICATION n=1 Tax=Theobroma cacao TaxID=3641 RepID=A0AB32VKS7_THECC|nr:PREDICTED: protein DETOXIFICATION 45, chloroplastic isoform X2 [Theobroma cacao]
MTISQFKGRLPCRITERNFGRGESKNAMKARWSCSFLLAYRRRRLSFNNAIKCCGSTGDQHTSDHISLSSSSIRKRSDSNDASVVTDGILDSTRTPLTSQSSLQSVQTELIMLALPAIVGQAIEPLAQLMETAFIGRLGAYQLASAAVSITIFNIISKVFNIPLLSVATSFVAEDISETRKEFASDESAERQFLPSVSTALLLALAIGIFEASAMYMGSAVFVNIMGLSSASPMYIPAQKFLSVRAIGAPAVVVSLAIQGIFRGFKDTKTPVLCLGLGNLSAIFLFPILMYSYGLGVTGAAISTVLSQYIVAILMIWHLNKRTVLLLPGIKNLQFGGYLKSGGFLLGRTLVSVMTITLSTSMAARLGPLALAAHQICLQVWLSVSLLFDAQAASGQALIASSLAKGDYARVKEITYCTLKTGLFTGISLAVILGASFGSLATLFTRDKEVLRIIRSVLLLVSSSLPITALAYTFDGLHYGISDFSYAAFSMMVVGAVSSAFLLFASSVMGLSGVWTGLALFMGLRTGAGLLRISSKNGPWFFLQERH